MVYKKVYDHLEACDKGLFSVEQLCDFLSFFEPYHLARASEEGAPSDCPDLQDSIKELKYSVDRVPTFLDMVDHEEFSSTNLEGYT